MPVHIEFTPEMENQIASWIKNNWDALQADRAPIRPCITISREVGCNAYQIAKELKKTLAGRVAQSDESHNWMIINRYIIDKMLRMAANSEADLKDASKTNPIFHSLFSLIFDKHIPAEYDVYQYLKQTIKRLVQAGDCIIIGSGSVAFTQDYEHCFNVRLIAPLEERIGHIKKSYKMTEKEAIAFIEKQEKKTDDFIHRFTSVYLRDESLYHMIINTSKFTPHAIAKLIEAGLVEKSLL